MCVHSPSQDVVHVHVGVLTFHVVEGGLGRGLEDVAVHGQVLVPALGVEVLLVRVVRVDGRRRPARTPVYNRNGYTLW